jgi:hypothetical protein
LLKGHKNEASASLAQNNVAQKLKLSRFTAGICATARRSETGSMIPEAGQLSNRPIERERAATPTSGFDAAPLAKAPHLGAPALERPFLAGDRDHAQPPYATEGEASRSLRR